MTNISARRVSKLLQGADQVRILVVGDIMLDRFIRGRVNRVSPEAPVPVLEFESESLMPGGAANVARNLAALGVNTELIGIIGQDQAGAQLRHCLRRDAVGAQGLIVVPDRPTTTKTRLTAGQQQIVRLDHEVTTRADAPTIRRLLRRIDQAKEPFDAVIIGDYGKGVVTQELVDGLRTRFQGSGCWLSMDPKPVHPLDIQGFSLLTPNRREAFALAGMTDPSRTSAPMKDRSLLEVSRRLLEQLKPAVLLITLGELGLLLCQLGQPVCHIPTVAREVFDVSGAGDTVIAAYTLAICLGASPLEAAILANHAAGLVVGKRGTATVTIMELRSSFA